MNQTTMIVNKSGFGTVSYELLQQRIRDGIWNRIRFRIRIRNGIQLKY